MGAHPGNRNTVNFRLPRGSLPEKRGGNVWVSKGHTYDFVHIRYKSSLKKSDIKCLFELLKIDKLPAKHPLRRVLVRMFIKGLLDIETFYGLVRPKKKIISKPVRSKIMFAHISKDEEDRLIYEAMNHKKFSEADQQKIWLKKAYRRMRVKVPDWINSVIVNKFTAFDQLWKRTSSGKGKYCVLEGTELEERAHQYLDDKNIKGLFINKRRVFGEMKDVLYVMDDCPKEHLEVLNI